MRKLLTNTVALGLFFPSMLWLLFELRWMENAVGGRWLVLLVLAIAAAPAWWLGRGIARAANPWPDRSLLASRDDAVRRREAGSAGFLAGAGALVLAVSGASWANHALATRIEDVPVTVVGRGLRESSPRSAEEWRLIVEVGGKREDVVVSAREWSRAAPGTRVSMRMMDGALGFPVLCSEVLRGRCHGQRDVAPAAASGSRRLSRAG